MRVFMYFIPNFMVLITKCDNKITLITVANFVGPVVQKLINAYPR